MTNPADDVIKDASGGADEGRERAKGKDKAEPEAAGLDAVSADQVLAAIRRNEFLAARAPKAAR